MEECISCGREFKHLGKHWRYYPEHRPNFNEKEKEIITGLLMSDGSIRKESENKNPFFVVQMTNREYLKYLENIFGILGGKTKLRITGEENGIRTNKKIDFETNVENYSDVYEWKTISHPNLEEFFNWYRSGKKIWPENIHLSPTVMKHWYVGDGHWNTHRGHNYIMIGATNEIENKSKIEKYFIDVGLPVPDRWTEKELVWSVENSEALFDYMGKPLPGFEYKFPTGDQ